MVSTTEPPAGSAAGAVSGSGMTPSTVVPAPDLGPAPESGEARLQHPPKVCTTRLIDNVALRLERAA